MTSSDELAATACPPPSSSSASSSGGLLQVEDCSTSTIGFGRREELRGLGEELIRLDCRPQYFEDYYCAWSYAFPDILEDADPELHDALHPYRDPDLLESHGENILDIVIRLASPQQWREWIGISADVAASSGASGVFVRLLASWGGPVDNGTLSGLLRSAARGGSVDILSALISAGAGPLVRMVDETGQSYPALQTAAERGHRSFVAKLIEAGAPVEAKPVGMWAALTAAVFNRRKGVVLELLAAGADVNTIDDTFRRGTPSTNGPCDRDSLQIAIQNRDEEMVNILLEAGADPSKEAGYFTPLHLAARQGSCQIINILLQAGARVNTVDATGRSSLHHACACSHPGTVDLLLRHNAGVSLLNNSGLSPIDVVGARLLALREWEWVFFGTAPRMPPSVARELEWELPLKSGRELNTGRWIARPSTLTSAETSTVDTICGMLQPFVAWSRRGWLVMMRSRHLAEVVAEQPDRSHAHAFALSVRDASLVHEPSGNTAGLRGTARASQASHDGEYATADWSGVVIWLLRSCDDSLFRNIVRFL